MLCFFLAVGGLPEKNEVFLREEGEFLMEVLLVRYEVNVSVIQHLIFCSKNDLNDLAVSYTLCL